jgi:hypothetical protein
VVARPGVEPDDLAPNHLLVPRERLRTVVERLGHVPRLTVTLLD